MEAFTQTPDIQTMLTGIASNVRLCRQTKGWRQQDLAERCGVSLQSIKNLESGRNTETRTFLKVAIVFGFSDDLLQLFTPNPATLDELERLIIARQDQKEAK